MSKNRYRRWAAAVVLGLVVVYLCVRLLTGAALSVLDAPFDGNNGAATDVTITHGATATDVAAMLENAGVIEDERVLRWWMRYSDTAGSIHTGHYRFKGPASVRQVAEVITEGRVLLRAVTIVEGMMRWDVAQALADSGFGTYDDAWEASGAGALIHDLDPEAVDLEGYLFPDTYHAPEGSTAAELVGMMLARFRQVWTPERQVAAESSGFDVRELVTIASLVEGEAARDDERALVSGVYHNRLDTRMLLQCDPTLLYALRLDGRTDRNIRRADFANESPYNTYRFSGLPPGPIGNPGEASIDAALAPADTEFLYFVGRNDGSHAFSRTLREHNANVNRYQR